MINRQYIVETLGAIQGGYPWQVSQFDDPELGMRYFVQVENPRFKEDDGSDVYLVFEVFED